MTHRLPGLAPRLPLPKLTPLRGGALPRGLAQGRAEDKRGLSAQPLDPDAQARTLALPRASCVTSSTFLNLSLVSVRRLYDGRRRCEGVHTTRGRAGPAHSKGCSYYYGRRVGQNLNNSGIKYALDQGFPGLQKHSGGAKEKRTIRCG